MKAKDREKKRGASTQQPRALDRAAKKENQAKFCCTSVIVSSIAKGIDPCIKHMQYMREYHGTHTLLLHNHIGGVPCPFALYNFNITKLRMHFKMESVNYTL